MTAPSPAPPATKLRPGGVWYVVGALLMLAGLGALIGLIAAGAVKTTKAVDNFARFVVTKEGTEATIKVDQAGSYTFYYESQSTVDGKEFTSPVDPPPDLQIAAKAQGGADLVVSPATSEVSFSFSGKVGRSIATVRIPSPGKYVVRATGGTTAAPFVVSMGKGQVARLMKYVLGGLGLGALLGIGGLVTVIVTGAKRKKNRRAQLAMSASLPQGAPSWGTAPGMPGPASPGAWTPTAPTGYPPQPPLTPAPSSPGSFAPGPYVPAPPGGGLPPVPPPYAPPPTAPPAAPFPGSPPPPPPPPMPLAVPDEVAEPGPATSGGWAPPPPPPAS